MSPTNSFKHGKDESVTSKAFYDFFPPDLSHTLQKELYIYVMLNVGAGSTEITKCTDVSSIGQGYPETSTS